VLLCTVAGDVRHAGSGVERPGDALARAETVYGLASRGRLIWIKGAARQLRLRCCFGLAPLTYVNGDPGAVAKYGVNEAAIS
jgi:hypothetical protein